jgi:serine-type D-Ala-D-Ala carboxypeptidase (penicillin-binding protein 5/6)
MKLWISLLLTIALALPAIAQEEGPASAKGTQVDTTGKGYTAAYVIEPSTKRVLFAENADTPFPIASMTKMMTLLIAMEEIRDGRLKLNDPVPISARASTMGGSQIFAKQGQVFPLQTLLAATMVQSANDAAQAIAEKIAGSSENFAEIMNQRAKALGMNHTTFYDPHGLPNPKNPQVINTSSARDMAIVGLEVMKYPLMREYAKTATMPFTNGTFTSGLTNPNHLVNPSKRDYYPNATGIKTGYSGPAGYCITASAKQGEMELVAVVMGARASFGPMSSFGIASRLFSQNFAQNIMQTVLKKGQSVGNVAVNNGSAKTVGAVAAADVKALVKRGEQGGIKVGFVGNPLTAPVTAGQQVGVVVVTQNGQQISRVPAIAAAAVEKQSWWRKLWPF